MSEFKKELRYYVVKVSDAQQFSDEAKHALENVLYASQIVRKLRDAPQIDCVVVESDWPEYEIVWGMIQARVEGRPNQITTLQSELAAARTQIALYLDDYEQLCALMLRRDKDLAAAREELARAREVLISAWTLDAYNMGYDLHGEARAKAMARYAREIAHKGEEG